LCLIVAQWEWPDMMSPLDLLYPIQFTRHLVQPAIFLGERLERVKLLRLAPGLVGQTGLALAVTDVAEMVPERRLVAAAALGDGGLENCAGLGQLAAPE